MGRSGSPNWQTYLDERNALRSGEDQHDHLSAPTSGRAVAVVPSIRPGCQCETASSGAKPSAPAGCIALRG